MQYAWHARANRLRLSVRLPSLWGNVDPEATVGELNTCTAHVINRVFIRIRGQPYAVIRTRLIAFPWYVFIQIEFETDFKNIRKYCVVVSSSTARNLLWDGHRVVVKRA